MLIILVIYISNNLKGLILPSIMINVKFWYTNNFYSNLTSQVLLIITIKCFFELCHSQNSQDLEHVCFSFQFLILKTVL